MSAERPGREKRRPALRFTAAGAVPKTGTGGLSTRMTDENRPLPAGRFDGRCDRDRLAAKQAPGKSAPRRVSSSERGGWRLFGRILIWATRNNIIGEDVP
jgi:hypothetical protein